jgi:hypothetical protein
MGAHQTGARVWVRHPRQIAKASSEAALCDARAGPAGERLRRPGGSKRFLGGLRGIERSGAGWQPVEASAADEGEADELNRPAEFVHFVMGPQVRAGRRASYRRHRHAWATRGS